MHTSPTPQLREGAREGCLLKHLIKLNFAKQNFISSREKSYHCLWAEAAVSNYVLNSRVYSIWYAQCIKMPVRKSKSSDELEQEQVHFEQSLFHPECFHDLPSFWLCARPICCSHRTHGRWPQQSSQTPDPKLLKEQMRPWVPMVSCQCASESFYTAACNLGVTLDKITFSHWFWSMCVCSCAHVQACVCLCAQGIFRGKIHQLFLTSSCESLEVDTGIRTLILCESSVCSNHWAKLPASQCHLLKSIQGGIHVFMLSPNFQLVSQDHKRENPDRNPKSPHALLPFLFPLSPLFPAPWGTQAKST